MKKFDVTFTHYGFATIEAETEEEAWKLAEGYGKGHAERAEGAEDNGECAVGGHGIDNVARYHHQVGLLLCHHLPDAVESLLRGFRSQLVVEVGELHNLEISVPELQRRLCKGLANARKHGQAHNEFLQHSVLMVGYSK